MADGLLVRRLCLPWREWSWTFKSLAWMQSPRRHWPKVRRAEKPFLTAATDDMCGVGTGARGLRSIMESVLMDAMFETPSDAVGSVIIDAEVA
jgi:hypothetical protein